MPVTATAEKSPPPAHSGRRDRNSGRIRDTAIRGVMLESLLQPGRQDVILGRDLTYGQSITDACRGWDTSVEVLHSLAAAVRARRHVGALTTGSNPLPDEVLLTAASACGMLATWPRTCASRSD